MEVYFTKKAYFDEFEEVLNKYSSIGSIQNTLGTSLREEDFGTFRNLFKKWRKEFSNTRWVLKTRATTTTKKYKWLVLDKYTKEERIQKGIEVFKRMEL